MSHPGPASAHKKGLISFQDLANIQIPSSTDIPTSNGKLLTAVEGPSNLKIGVSVQPLAVMHLRDRSSGPLSWTTLKLTLLNDPSTFSDHGAYSGK